MFESEKKLLTVNEYAAENHVSRQSVNSKINRHKDELKGHVFIINGRKMIDGFAQDFLKPTKDNALLISKNAELEKSLERASRWMEIVDGALEVLEPQEREILQCMYVFPQKGAVDTACDALCVEKSSIYRRRDKALRKFTLAMYGATESN